MKKIVFLLALTIGMGSVSYTASAQTKEEKKAAAELKKKTQFAKRVVKDAKEEFEKLKAGEGGQLNNVKRSVDQAMNDPLTADWVDTWLLAADVYNRLYIELNSKSYTKEPYDTVEMYNKLVQLFDICMTCDSLEQIPDEKGRTTTECRKKMANILDMNRNNLINGGIFYFNRKHDYKKAYELFDMYYRVADCPMLKEITANDPNYSELAVQFAYFPTLAAFNMESYDKVLKYCDLGIKDSLNGDPCLKMKCQSYEKLGDTENWIASLKQGIELFPKEDYYYSALIVHYNNTDNMAELESFVENMREKDPDKAYNYYVIGFLNQQQNKYEEAVAQYEIAVEKDPTLVDAYLNLAYCYQQMASKFAEENSSVNPRSSQYKQIREQEKEFYRKALPHALKVREIAPEMSDKWSLHLYQIYYKLDMRSEMEEIEKVLKALDLL